jgi:hypothetical protein
MLLGPDAQNLTQPGVGPYYYTGRHVLCCSTIMVLPEALSL